MFIKKPVNLIIFISTLLIFGAIALTSSTKQVETNKTIATLINNYYEAVENEDLSAVGDLLYAESEAKKKELIAYHKFVFDAVDTKMNSIAIENMELNEDDQIGVIFVTVNSDIYDINASDSFNKLSHYAVIIKKSNHRWLIAKIMRAEDFNTVLKLTLFNKYAHEIGVTQHKFLTNSYPQFPFFDDFSSGLANWDISRIKPELVGGKLYWETGQFATLTLKVAIPMEDIIIEFDGYVKKNGFNIYCWNAANKGYTVFIGGWYNTKSGSDVGAGGEKRVLVNGAVWKAKEWQHYKIVRQGDDLLTFCDGKLIISRKVKEKFKGPGKLKFNSYMSRVGIDNVRIYRAE